MFVNHVVTHFPIPNTRLGEIKDDLEQVTVCNKIQCYVTDSQLARTKLDSTVKLNFAIAGQITIL